MKKMICDNEGMIVIHWELFMIITVIVNFLMPYSEKDLLRFLISIVEIFVLGLFIIVWLILLSPFIPSDVSPNGDLIFLALINSLLTYVIFHMSLYQLVKYVKMRRWNNIKSHFVYFRYENRHHRV